MAYHILKNVTVITSGNVLNKNTELALFWSMFHHMEDINPPTRMICLRVISENRKIVRREKSAVSTAKNVRSELSRCKK